MGSRGQDASISAYRSLPTDDYDTPLQSSISNEDRVEQVKFAPRSPMERQIALQAALEIDPGVQKLSWAAIQVSISMHFASYTYFLPSELSDVSRDTGCLLLLGR